MKLSCEKAAFAPLFSVAASIAATRDTRPILQNVKIKAGKKDVQLHATDTELGVRLSVEGCTIHKTGEAILPAKRLKDLLSVSNSETIDIETVDGKVAVKAGENSNFKLDAYSADEFPDVEGFDEKSYYEIPASVLKEMLRRTVFSTETDTARYALGGVLLEFVDGRIVAVATDGKRLAFQEGIAEKKGNFSQERAIFPAKAIQLLTRSLPDDETPVQIGVSETRGIFQFGQAVFFTRLLEGRFPNWRNIVPATEERAEIQVMAGALLSALLQANVVSSDYAPGIVFTFENAKLLLKGSGTEIGQSEVSIPVTYLGETLELKLDPKFISEYLRVLPSETLVTLYYKDGDPVLFKTDDDYNYIVMTMTLN